MLQWKPRLFAFAPMMVLAAALRGEVTWRGLDQFTW
jgi:hypothetical protein